jgi:hypothetical protein
LVPAAAASRLDPAFEDTGMGSCQQSRRGAPLLTLLLSACAGAPPPPTGKPALTVVNKSQFVLLKLMLHTKVDNHVGRPNLLPAPLPPDGQITFADPVILPGTWFVTVVREKVKHGPLVAVTTGNGLQLDDGLYTLWVFDESFRLFPPVRWEGARDWGRADGRPADRSVEGLPCDRTASDSRPADRVMLERGTGELGVAGDRGADSSAKP